MLNLYALLLYVRTHIKLNNIADTLFKKPTQQINWKGQTKKSHTNFTHSKREAMEWMDGAHLHRDDAKLIWPIMGYIENKICIKLNLESILVTEKIALKLTQFLFNMSFKCVFFLFNIFYLFCFSIFYFILFLPTLPSLFFPKFQTY